jgi:single-strand DNA-binding protein
MKALKNKVTLIGNLGTSPEVKELQNGKKVARLRIAINEQSQSKNGQIKEKVQWHNLVMWGGLATVAEKYLDKGVQIAVEGKLNNRSWTDREGIKRFTTEVVVSDMLMLGK